MVIDARGPQGNALAIMGAVRHLLLEMGREDDISATLDRMQAGDFRHLCEVAEEVTDGELCIVNLDDDE